MPKEEEEEIDKMILDRERLRKEKNFEDADRIRYRLNEKNIELIDHKGRTVWMKKEKIRSEK